METQREYENEANWLKVFCPNVRILSQEEITSLPAEKRTIAEAGGETGLWLGVRCPEESCVIGNDVISLRVKGVTARERKDLWLSVFCPEDQCMASAASDLP